MADNRPPYHRRPTRPLPREELAPISSAAEDIEPEPETRPDLEETERRARKMRQEAITHVPCPVCRGQGMVAPDIAAAFECFCVELEDK